MGADTNNNRMFRLHDGATAAPGWIESKVISPKDVQGIKDPDGAKASKEITSIPSPFARFNIVKTAFEQVTIAARSDINNLDGRTIYHKLVSDALDIGQIFFEYDKFKSNIEIIKWDKSQLDNLNQSAGQTCLADSLSMFLEQDAAAFNFDNLDGIYMLNYIGADRPYPLNIIGGTSPCSLFMATANDWSGISKHIAFGDDYAFDSDYKPLYERDFNYFRFLWALSLFIPDFSTAFKGVYDYLRISYQKLDNQQKKALDEVTGETYKDYAPLNFGANNNSEVEILRHPIFCKKQGAVLSDFEIVSTCYKEGRTPLVLPLPGGNRYSRLRYVTSDWTGKENVPIKDPAALEDRYLPQDGSKYPYLTIGDFLEDTIVEMLLPINSEGFFDPCNPEVKEEDRKYLLPLTDRFFEFFTPDELRKNQALGGKPMLSIVRNAGGSVSVTLTIPIKGNGEVNCIEYTKEYHSGSKMMNGKGGLISKTFGLGIMPLYTFDAQIKPYYTISLFDKGNYDLRLRFFKNNGEEVSCNRIVRREKNLQTDNCSMETDIVSGVFDWISLDFQQGIKAALIPLFKKGHGTDAYTFAVDFGTTNTHVEYSVNGHPSKSFDEDPARDVQMTRLNKGIFEEDKDIEGAFVDNYLPDEIGEGKTYSFPLRTVLQYRSNMNFNQRAYAFADSNVAFIYEKKKIQQDSRVETELKWNVSEDASTKTRMFLENLFLMMRQKVVLNQGDLEKTKVVWFYPVSMTPHLKGNLGNMWSELYKKHISDQISNVIAVSESQAPYIFYTKKKGTATNVVTIDIGGGSTDIFIAENATPRCIASFRYAANDIFGDGYNNTVANNGFVQSYCQVMENKMEDNKINTNILRSIMENGNGNSKDVVSYFFSLSQNPEYANIPGLNFLELLERDANLKYVFILFYGSLLYYVANLMKANGLEKPLTIAFSGNGSKTISVLGSMDNLKDYIRLIFEKVYDEPYKSNNPLQLILEEQPKKATCKGGIIGALNPPLMDQKEINQLKKSLVGIDKKTMVSGNMKFQCEGGGIVDNEKIWLSNDDLVSKIETSAIKCIDFIFELDNAEGGDFFNNCMGAKKGIASRIKDIAKEYLDQYVRQGLFQHQAEMKNTQQQEKNLDETFFFLPFKGMLNHVATAVYAEFHE